jgi:DNA-binding NarL/FixJ family response regulator
VRTARVLVVHRQALVAEALARRIDAESGLRTVEIAATASAARLAANALGPDVAVIETPPDDRTALELAARFVAHAPPIAVVALLEGDDVRAAIRAVRAGASAVVTKRSSAADLVEAVLAVAGEHAWVSRDLLGPMLHELRVSSPAPNEYDLRLARLTPRERDVLDLLVSGRDRSTIARQLGVSIETIRTHTRNILAKLQVHSSLEAVSVARRGNQTLHNVG